MTEEVNHQNDGLSIVVDKTIASIIHQHLKDGDYINYDFMIKDLGQQIAIPVKKPELISSLEWYDEKIVSFEAIKLEAKKPNRTPAQDIVSRIEDLLLDNSLLISKEMVSCLPKKWELFNDLAILPSGTLESKEWHDICSQNKPLTEEIWQIIADALKDLVWCVYHECLKLMCIGHYLLVFVVDQ